MHPVSLSQKFSDMNLPTSRSRSPTERTATGILLMEQEKHLLTLTFPEAALEETPTSMKAKGGNLTPGVAEVIKCSLHLEEIVARAVYEILVK